MKQLSNLQKKILLIALNDKNKQYQVEAWQVLNRVYGFPLSGKGQIRFNRRKIGIKRYLAATASVCKSLNRLELRGLGEREPRAGLFLNKKGVVMARKVKEAG